MVHLHKTEAPGSRQKAAPAAGAALISGLPVAEYRQRCPTPRNRQTLLCSPTVLSARVPRSALCTEGTSFPFPNSTAKLKELPRACSLTQRGFHCPRCLQQCSAGAGRWKRQGLEPAGKTCNGSKKAKLRRGKRESMEAKIRHYNPRQHDEPYQNLPKRKQALHHTIHLYLSTKNHSQQ